MDRTEDNSIHFLEEDGTETVFFVEEQTRVNGTDYLLVSDSDGEEANAYILKDTSADGDETAAYVMVEDEVELEAIADVFRRMIDEADLQ